MVWMTVVALVLSSFCIPLAAAQNGSTVTSGCQGAALAQHNFLRSMHQAPALVWNDSLATAAQVWANSLAASACSLELESNITGGENTWAVASGVHSTAPCSYATLGWYSQGLDWAFSDSNTPITDNLALLGSAYSFVYALWAGVEQLGCGAAQGSNGCWAVVCRYPPVVPVPQLTDEVEAAYLANIKAPVTPANLPVTADQQQCQQAALAKLNAYRADHGSPPLTWNSSLASTSLVLAISSANISCNTSWLSTKQGLDGFSSTNSSADTVCGQAVDSFYATGNSSFNMTAAPWSDNQASYDQWHPFTQVIWKSTTQVGCGSAQGPDGCWTVICKYDPPGNVQSDSAFLQNVLPVGSSSNTNSAQSSSTSSSSGNRKKAIGIAVGVAVPLGVLLAVVAAALFWRQRRRQQRRQRAVSTMRYDNSKAPPSLTPLVSQSTFTGTGHTATSSDQPGRSEYPTYRILPSSSAPFHIMEIPGLMSGEPFTRGTAFEYSWNSTYSNTPGTAHAVEGGINDVQLDALVQGSSGQVQECPVVCLTKEQVKQQLQLLTHGLRGRGGAALVFKALWPSRFGPDALLAVKVLKDGYDCNPYVLQSFAHEASVLASVRHPNVVKLYGYCLDPPNVCLIMELLPCSLKEVLYGGQEVMADTSDMAPSNVSANPSSVGSPMAHFSQQISSKECITLSMSQVVQISTDIAAGLAYLHDQPEQMLSNQGSREVFAFGEAQPAADVDPTSGHLQKIVHRDLKPANILINSLGQVKISDFGLARRHDSTTIETRHVGAGTVPYQAPEILSGSRAGAYGMKATNRCDVYSMAMIFWEMLSKQPPWKEMNEVGILSQVLNGKRPELPAPDSSPTAADSSVEEPSLDLTQLPASLTALPAYNDIIRQCWAQRDWRRPTAAEAHRLLLELQHKYHSPPVASVRVVISGEASKKS